MGSGISKEEKQKAEEEEKRKRTNLERRLGIMNRRLYITHLSHYESAKYYRKWDIRLQYLSLVVGAGGATGGLASTFNWKAFVGHNPRLAPLVAATSATLAILSVIVQLLPKIQSMPADLHKMHFKAGTECQYLEEKVKFMSETEVWDYEVPWESLASKYETLLRDKKEVNSIIQTEEWAYRKNWENVEKWKNRKREQSVRVEEGTKQ